MRPDGAGGQGDLHGRRIGGRDGGLAAQRLAGRDDAWCTRAPGASGAGRQDLHDQAVGGVRIAVDFDLVGAGLDGGDGDAVGGGAPGVAVGGKGAGRRPDIEIGVAGRGLQGHAEDVAGGEGAAVEAHLAPQDGAAGRVVVDACPARSPARRCRRRR